MSRLFKSTRNFVKSRLLSISNWTNELKRRRSKIIFSFMSIISLWKISKTTSITIFSSISFETNERRLEIFEKKSQCVDRIYFMSFKIDDVFYLRLLLFNKKKCTSFENLRTIFIQIENVEKSVTKSKLMKIYYDVCIILRLIDNDDEWHVVTTKIIEFDTTTMLRSLMMTILLKYVSTQSLRL